KGGEDDGAEGGAEGDAAGDVRLTAHGSLITVTAPSGKLCSVPSFEPRATVERRWASVNAIFAAQRRKAPRLPRGPASSTPRGGCRTHPARCATTSRATGGSSRSPN